MCWALRVILPMRAKRQLRCGGKLSSLLKDFGCIVMLSKRCFRAEISRVSLGENSSRYCVRKRFEEEYLSFTHNHCWLFHMKLMLVKVCFVFFPLLCTPRPSHFLSLPILLLLQALEIMGGVATIITANGRIPGEQRACKAGKTLPSLPVLTEFERMNNRRAAGTASAAAA